jgi:hypothetical protein
MISFDFSDTTDSLGLFFSPALLDGKEKRKKEKKKI